jgi:hypothetical protein
MSFVHIAGTPYGRAVDRILVTHPNEFQQVLQTLVIDELSHIANDRRASVRTLPEPFQFRTHVPKLC